MNKNFKLLKKTREYLDYVEEHLNNVEKAYAVLSTRCGQMRFIVEDCQKLAAEVCEHDVSKFSAQELTQYGDHFFPISDEEKKPLRDAWEHHKEFNKHHWQTWTQIEFESETEWEIHAAHMVIDWLAMSYKFGGTPREYYEGNRDKIDIPEKAVKFIYEIFDNLEGEPYWRQEGWMI